MILSSLRQRPLSFIKPMRGRLRSSSSIVVVEVVYLGDRRQSAPASTAEQVPAGDSLPYGRDHVGHLMADLVPERFLPGIHHLG